MILYKYTARSTYEKIECIQQKITRVMNKNWDLKGLLLIQEITPTYTEGRRTKILSEVEIAKIYKLGAEYIKVK